MLPPSPFAASFSGTILATTEAELALAVGSDNYVAFTDPHMNRRLGEEEQNDSLPPADDSAPVEQGAPAEPAAEPAAEAPVPMPEPVAEPVAAPVTEPKPEEVPEAAGGEGVGGGLGEDDGDDDDAF